MKRRGMTLALLLALPTAVWAQKKEIVELQRDVALLQDQVRTLQRAFDEKMGALTLLLQQTLEAANKGSANVTDRLKEQEKVLVAPVAGLGTRMDQMATEFSTVRESVAEMNTRMVRLQTQLKDVADAVKTIQAPPPPPAPAAAGNAPPQGVTAQSLYDNAMRDKSGGNLDMAFLQFQDYLKFFPNTEYASNAQFYIGEIYYTKGDLDGALLAFDKVLTAYPESNKSADALYMKGVVQLKMGQRNNAAQAFRDVIKNFPSSDVAGKSRSQLKGMGLSVPATTTRKRR